MRSKWFSQGEIDPRSIIKLNKEWVVQQAISEHTFQKDHDDHLARRDPSWTAIRLLVEDRSARTKAYMRIYKQLMHGGTEAEPARKIAHDFEDKWTDEDPVNAAFIELLNGSGFFLLVRNKYT
ncbi:hypothetical protein BDQ94DRAFT_168823 [Aspergillus welwitschiae]|uniref:Uncharacterized protein n=1 Tax=Aspergillus welwitschiae TaxID=1341132 RepID=A0A3F3Q7I2_9EURO|nr:hypothetical protein BDQ94DRAFT_168823 [Aspergillus welwitschiae]RDH35150.1 hypothetical protein BDQ94DRAFT_168823 [Aspergillus welwitschiae]